MLVVIYKYYKSKNRLIFHNMLKLLFLPKKIRIYIFYKFEHFYYQLLY